MDSWKQKTKEEHEAETRLYLQKMRLWWDKTCDRLGLGIEAWQAEELLQKAAEAFSSNDRKAQTEAAERIRLRIAYALLQRAVAENNRDIYPATSEPGGGLRVEETDFGPGKKVRLSFFSGTSGYRIFVDPQGLTLPWVRDGDYTRAKNLLIRDAMKEVFPTAQGEEGGELVVPFVKKET